MLVHMKNGKILLGSLNLGFGNINKLILLLFLIYSCSSKKKETGEYAINLINYVGSKKFTFNVTVVYDHNKTDHLVTKFIGLGNLEYEIFVKNAQLEFIYLIYSKYMQNLQFSNYEFIFTHDDSKIINKYTFSNSDLKTKSLKMQNLLYAQQVDTILSIFSSSELYNIEYKYNFIDSALLGYKPKVSFFEDYYEFVNFKCNNKSASINNKATLKLLMLYDLTRSFSNTEFDYILKQKLKRIMSICDFEIERYKRDDYAPSFFKMYRIDSLQYEKY